MSLLQEYAKPRDRITALLAAGNLIRVRKGLYVLGDKYRRGPIHREILANLIYGPSYVSLDYALSQYGLIPERVEDVTSITTGENKKFSTPLGVFTYQHLPLRRYSTGIQWISTIPAPILRLHLKKRSLTRYGLTSDSSRADCRTTKTTSLTTYVWMEPEQGNSTAADWQ